MEMCIPDSASFFLPYIFCIGRGRGSMSCIRLGLCLQIISCTGQIQWLLAVRLGHNKFVLGFSYLVGT